MPKRPVGSPKSSYAKRQKKYTPYARTKKPVSSNTNMSKFQKGGGIEKKFLDTTQNGAFPGTTGGAVLTLLNGMAPGTSQITRIGSRIDVKSVQFKCLFSSGTSATGVTPFRVKIVYDKETNGVALQATDVLVSDDIDALNNLSQAGRFITLLDKTWDPIPAINATGAAGFQSQLLEGFCKCSLPVKYNAGTAGTVADISSGSIYALCYTNGATIGGAGLNDEMQFRIRFTDQ